MSGSGLFRLCCTFLGFVIAMPAALAAPAPPQLLPYTSVVVVGGGPYNSAIAAGGTTYTSSSQKYTVGQSCGANSTLTATDTYGNGCMGTQLTIVTPRAVATDSQGNVFVIDSYNFQIRRVDAHTGIVTAYAGGGFMGSSSTSPTGPTLYTVGQACASGSTLTAQTPQGDGCLATQVSLASPEGLAVDANDNVWYSDYNTGSIREISHATGIITTVVNVAGTLGYRAGNVADPGVVVPAAQGMTVHPYGLGFDTNGNLYIADNYNNVVDAVNLGTSAVTIAGVSIPAGAIYTIAGAGCAYGPSTAGCSTYGKMNGVGTNSKLDSPYQVAVDNAGNIYIADEFPYDVRVLSPSGTLASFANQAFTKNATIPRGPAISTPLASTYGVATDSAGDVYIGVYDSTSSSSYIERVDIATGIIYAVGGQQVTAPPAGGQSQVAGAGAKYCGAATDAVGDGCPGTQATFYKPYQPWVDAAGNVYVADQANQLVRKLATGAQFTSSLAVGTAATQTLEVHFGAGDTQGSYTVGAGFGDFTLGASACTTNSDMTQDCLVPVTFKPSAPGVRTAPLVVKSAGGLVSTFALSGTGLGAVLAVDPGARAALATNGVTAVSGVAVDQAGNTYAAVPSASSIVKLSAAGVASNVGTGLTGATSVAVDGTGNVFAGLGSGSVVEVPASGAAQATVATGITKLVGLAADALGNVYVADAGTNQISEVNAKTGVLRVIATAATGVATPGQLAVDFAGNVFVANTVGNNVLELPFAGGAGVALGAGLSAPQGVGTDAAGNVYAADTKNGRVVLIPNEGGNLNTADQLTIATGLVSPVGVALANSGLLTVADSGANTVYTYTRSAGAVGFGNVPIATQATGVADLVSAGNAPVTLATPYFSETGNTTDFNLTPATLSGGGSLAAGFTYVLTPGFMPTATGPRSAVFSIAATNTAAPTLTLSGVGITPVDPTTTTITVTPGNGTYGQSETISVTVAAAPGLPVPGGTVVLQVDASMSAAVTLVNGTYTFAPMTLTGGSHTLMASYSGDPDSTPSKSTPVTFTLTPLPLKVVVNSLTAVYGTTPAFTGTVTGSLNGEAVGVKYTSAGTATSGPGTYSITATLAGNAALDYTPTVTPGTLTISKAGTTTTLTSSSGSVANGGSAVLTATVASTVAGTLGAAPSGLVTFYNGKAAIGTGMLSGGTATLPLSFPSAATISLNSLTAVYGLDNNYTGSTSAAVSVYSGPVGFVLNGVPSALTISQGQTGLTSFTFAPLFAYTGTVSFACTGLPATVGCVFSPATVAADGSNTASLVALSVTTVQPGVLAQAAPESRPGERGLAPLAFAGIPGLMLLGGVMLQRRRMGWNALKGASGVRLLVLCMMLGALGLGATGCGVRSTLGTPKGAFTVNVVATGTPAAGTTTAFTQQFSIAVTVQ